MAVAFDAKPTGSSPIFDVSFNAAASVTLTTMTVGSGANRALVAAVTFDIAVTSPAMHWDSAGTNQLMTQIGTGSNGSGGGLSVGYFFGLLAPTSGNKNLSATWTGSAVGYLSTTSWTGVLQTSAATAFINFTTNPNSASGTNSTITVPTTSGNATVEWGSNRGGGPSNLGSQTLWSQDTALAPNQWGNYALSVSSSTAYATAIGTGTNSNVEIGCDIVAASGAADVLQAQIVM